MRTTRLTAAATVALLTLPATAVAAHATWGQASTGPTGSTGTTGSAEQLTRLSTITDKDGTTHTRFSRSYRGLPVIGGDLVEHRKAGGALIGRSVNGKGRITVPSITPRITADQAERAATGAYPLPTKEKKKGKGKGPAGPSAAGNATATAADSRGADAAATSLVVYTDGNTPRLAYQVTTTGQQADQTPSRRHTFVDARNARVITSWDDIATGTGDGVYIKSASFPTLFGSTTRGGYQLADGLGNNVHDLAEGTEGPGALMTDADDIWGDGTNGDPASAGVDVMVGSRESQAYFSYVLGRPGIWNNGTGVDSRVHFGVNYANAFWDGTQLTFGDGWDGGHPLTELDIVAHEWSHGITQYTAGLVYSGESGGLNEATSDIFAVGVEANADLPSDKPDYLIGEQIDYYGNGTPLRYLDRPSRDGISPDCWSSSVGSMDVHYSSGPLRHWFYLASQGSGAQTINGVDYDSPTCTGESMSGTGHEAIEKIWYRALTVYLTSRATYADARDAAIRSAKDLYGGAGKECAAVQDGFDAITVPKGIERCTG